MDRIKLLAVIEAGQKEISYDLTGKLSDLRKTMTDLQYISNDDLEYFVKLENGKVIETSDPKFEKYIPIKEYVYDTNKVRMSSLKESIEVITGTTSQFVMFNVKKSLADLRKLLVKQRYIENEDETHSWRFLIRGNLSGSETVPMDAGENCLPVKGFLYDTNKIRIIDMRRM